MLSPRPSGRIVYSPYDPRSTPAWRKAIVRPSGDQTGAESPPSCVSRTRLPPAVGMTQIEPPSLNAILRPSGDHVYGNSWVPASNF